MTPGLPPGHRLAFLLILLRVDRGDREGLAGDLAELHARRRAAGAGRLSASLLYWRELLGVLASYRPSPAMPDPHATASGDRPMTQLLADLRLAVRGLRRAPMFTGLAILTLALGIGATTAMFSVVRSVLLSDLPYPDADRVVMVWERDVGGDQSSLGYETYVDLREGSQTLQAAAVLGSGEVTLLGDGEPERLASLRVSREYFTVLGVSPSMGRDFAVEEDLPGAERVVILSHGLWQRRFGGDPAIIGRTVVMSEIPFVVVGVMPAGFRDYLAPQAQLWTTLRYDAQPFACRTCRHLRFVARLAPGVAVPAAQRELDLRFERILAEHPTDYRSVGTSVVVLQTQLTSGIQAGLLAITAGVAFVLLIAVANVMNLQLGRAARRETEFAVRAALGAGRWQVVRQLLTENLLLAGVGGGLGVLVAAGGIRLLTSMDRLSLPRMDAVALDGAVLLFALAVTVVTGVGFGMAPAWSAGRGSLHGVLKQGTRGAGGGRHRFRAGLVVAEVGLALVLLAGAGLMVRSLSRLLGVELGFRPDRLLTMEVRAVGARYDSLGAVVGLADRVVALVEALPGVESAAWASMLPLGGDFNRYGVVIASQPLPNRADAPTADRYLVSSGYLATMGISVRQGRSFTPADRAGSDRVAVINQTFAARAWSGRDPLGDRVQLGGPEGPWWTVVGVVGDVKHIGLDAGPTPQIYLPQGQWMYNEGLGGLVVRTRGDPTALIEPVRRAIRDLEPDSPISRVATMDDLLAGSTADRRYALWLFGGFAVLALLLSAAGTYGVLANSVQERTREIGIRTALGASRRSILRQILGEGLRLTGIGVALGGMGALLLSRVLRGLLFGVAPHDPITFVGVVLVLAATAVAACWIPARRAASVPPAEVLRE